MSFDMILSELENGLFGGSHRAVGHNAMTPLQPRLDVWANAESVWIETDLPGFSAADVEITVKGDELSISGKAPKANVENAKCVYRERAALKDFARRLSLPFAVDSEKVEASFKDGVLRIQAQRAEQDKPRKIAVK